MEVNLKWISLIILVFQNTLLVFVMRYSKTHSKYISSTAVVCSECVKLLLSSLIHIFNRCREIEPPQKYTFKMLLDELFGKESDCIKIMVPAVLYLIQNNLQYYSASKLDAATFQITYQMKLIITAIFSVIILKRRLFKHQWISIVLLALGIALVQFPTGDNSAKEVDLYEKLLGFISVFIACLSSGFAGVYFEKILKKSKVTLWARNVQLSLFSVIPGYFIGCLFIDGDIIKENGFFFDYTRWTVLTIFCQAVGGIVVAIVVKYADNILKGFANSISILLSCAINFFFFDFNITLIFIIGCGIVLYSTYLYGKPVKDEQREEEYIRLEDQDGNGTSLCGESGSDVQVSVEDHNDEITIMNDNKNEDSILDELTEEITMLEEQSKLNNSIPEDQNNNNNSLI